MPKKRGSQIEEPSLDAKRRLTQVYLQKKETGKYSVAKFIGDTPELAGHKRNTVDGWLRQTQKRLEEQQLLPQRQIEDHEPPQQNIQQPTSQPTRSAESGAESGTESSDASSDIEAAGEEQPHESYKSKWQRENRAKRCDGHCATACA